MKGPLSIGHCPAATGVMPPPRENADPASRRQPLRAAHGTPSAAATGGCQWLKGPGLNLSHNHWHLLAIQPCPALPCPVQTRQVSLPRPSARRPRAPGSLLTQPSPEASLGTCPYSGDLHAEHSGCALLKGGGGLAFPHGFLQHLKGQKPHSSCSAGCKMLIVQEKCNGSKEGNQQQPKRARIQRSSFVAKEVSGAHKVFPCQPQMWLLLKVLLGCFPLLTRPPAFSARKADLWGGF